LLRLPYRWGLSVCSHTSFRSSTCHGMWCIVNRIPMASRKRGRSAFGEYARLLHLKCDDDRATGARRPRRCDDFEIDEVDWCILRSDRRQSKFTSPQTRYATGFTPVEIGFCTTPISISGATRVVQRPVNHRGKPGGGQKFACLGTSFIRSAFIEDAVIRALDFALNESMPQSRRRRRFEESQRDQQDAEGDEGATHKAADGLPVTEDDAKAEVLPEHSP
jgi:hypothetical protein